MLEQDPASRRSKEVSPYSSRAERALILPVARAGAGYRYYLYRQNFLLTLDRWVFEAKIETASSQGITQAPLFVRTQDNKGNGRGLNSP